MSSLCRRRLVTAAAVAALVGSTTASAYLLKGVKWTTSTVPYYVNPANLDLDAGRAEGAVRFGADTWALQSSAHIALVYAGTTSGTTVQNNSKNEVFFRNASNGSAVATTYSYYSGDKILDTDIVFWDGAFKFFSGTSGCSGGMYIEDIAAHEFGHALGLGHSETSGATMYASVSYCSQALRTLAADDIAGIEAVYPGSKSAPAAPANVTVTVASANPTGQLNVSWADRSADEDRFRVERSADGALWALAGNTPANVVSFADGGLQPGTTYSYRVRAENTGGESAYAGPVSNATEPVQASPAAPAAPASPNPADGAANVSVNADLFWAAAAGATSYDVYFGASPAPPLYASGVVATSLALPRLDAGVKYFWVVVAKNAAGATTGAQWSFTTKAARGAPKK